jgi:hypothetical protein
LEEARKSCGGNSNRENVSAKDIVTGIITAANRKMLRATTGTSRDRFYEAVPAEIYGQKLKWSNMYI